MDEFLESGECRRILFFEDAKGELVASKAPPGKLRKKTLYFLKLGGAALTAENMGHELCMGELGEQPLDQLSQVAQEVLLPIICNPRNQVRATGSWLGSTGVDARHRRWWTGHIQQIMGRLARNVFALVGGNRHQEGSCRALAGSYACDLCCLCTGKRHQVPPPVSVSILFLQDGWPDIIAKEVTDNLHKFIANIYVTIGQTKGKTLLALPPTDVSCANAGTLLETDACTPSECRFRTMCQTLSSPICWFL